MTNDTQTVPLVAGIYPTSRGFGYVVFEGPRFIRDWGTRDADKDKTPKTILGIKTILDRYEPEVLVLEDRSRQRIRSLTRASRLTVEVARLACERDIRVCRYSRSDIRSCFGEVGARTKEEIVTTIIQAFPQMKQELPPKRMTWMSEDPRMSIFDATTLVLTYYTLGEQREITI